MVYKWSDNLQLIGGKRDLVDEGHNGLVNGTRNDGITGISKNGQKNWAKLMKPFKPDPKDPKWKKALKWIGIGTVTYGAGKIMRGEETGSHNNENLNIKEKALTSKNNSLWSIADL